MAASISQRIDQIRPRAEAICASLEQEIKKLGLVANEARPRPLFALARCHTERDPYSGGETLVAVWLNADGFRIGSIKLHADDSFYAEFDVAEPHPADSRWFIEGVTAWGRGDEIKSEPKLLPALEET